jgi:PhzF family phenazine biosynthesis protein
MSAGYEFDWVDAFTDRPFGGNGCAVVHDADAMSDAECVAFTRETGLVECTFLCASDVADVRVRYFMASGEIPFAGHPTIASVAALIHRGRAAADSLRLETGVGVIAVGVDHSVSPARITMTQRAPVFGPVIDAGVVAAAIGLDPSAVVAPPQVVSTGLPFCITLLRDHETLAAARIDGAAMAAFRDAARTAGVEGFLEPYLVTLGGVTPAGTTFARLLLEPPLPPEDPFTGSATGAAAAWLWHHGHIARADYVAEQGHWMGRPGQAQVLLLGPRDAITGVRVAGQGHVLMSGRLMV